MALALPGTGRVVVTRNAAKKRLALLSKVWYTYFSHGDLPYSMHKTRLLLFSCSVTPQGETGLL